MGGSIRAGRIDRGRPSSTAGSPSRPSTPSPRTVRRSCWPSGATRSRSGSPSGCSSPPANSGTHGSCRPRRRSCRTGSRTAWWRRAGTTWPRCAGVPSSEGFPRSRRRRPPIPTRCVGRSSCPGTTRRSGRCAWGSTGRCGSSGPTGWTRGVGRAGPRWDASVPGRAAGEREAPPRLQRCDLGDGDRRDGRPLRGPVGDRARRRVTDRASSRAWMRAERPPTHLPGPSSSRSRVTPSISSRLKKAGKTRSSAQRSNRLS